MNSSFLRNAFIGLMLSSVPAVAGPHYTRMVQSKSVAANGLEFVVAVEDQWVSADSPYREEPVQVQLFIRNTTQTALLFPTFDTFGVTVRDASGKKIVQHGGRDATLVTKPVILDPGTTYCLSRKAELHGNPDGKTQTLCYYDGTGSCATYALAVGGYTLSFWCDCRPATTDAVTVNQWVGHVDTQEARFDVVEP